MCPPPEPAPEEERVPTDPVGPPGERLRTEPSGTAEPDPTDVTDPSGEEPNLED
jgi:hypothetical protein